MDDIGLSRNREMSLVSSPPGEAITFDIVHDKFDMKRIKQLLPAEHEQSPGGQSDELGKEAVK